MVGVYLEGGLPILNLDVFLGFLLKPKSVRLNPNDVGGGGVKVFLGRK